ncbi:Hsp20/alpha crystallin family protein [Flavilitoribacter nigricans]|uniref:SHSP domain-containing protein n=1 Tax=Flavilitoribacter nigricans (strain ATCC 23147 / DSM 23189 / NBRC 102662 / NCIMB 1420 / SS-2) TaxID=1122177 RepID=A0A2D0NAD5_FLAN2|nr:Hsp20/alpha crystallin family protein [Flavilitoribacter nigricans]PHN05346.1 hypothetical protein CRP01_17685 [Flavilitoribacter nigricans DSM 23189 = NBRC 102662]
MVSFTRGFSPEHGLSGYADRFFNQSFRRAWGHESSIDQSEITVPVIQVREEATGFLLEFTIPGHQRSDLNIQVNDRIWTISAKLEKSMISGINGNTDFHFTRREFHYQTFCRSFTLPENDKEDQIAANCNNGILVVKVPVDGRVEEQESPRSISVG